MLRGFCGLFLRPDTGVEGGAGAEAPVIDATASETVDLSAVRSLILLAHPDVIPELVAGANFDELFGSVEAARTAYQRVAAAVQTAASSATPEVTVPRVPAGGGQRQATINVEQLSPAAKISEGLRRRHSRGS